MNYPIVVLGGSGRLGRRFRRIAKEEGRHLINIDPREPAEFSADQIDHFELVSLAAHIAVEANNEALNAFENIFETNIMEPARFFAKYKERISRVVFASSLEVYGDSANEHPLREETPSFPTTAYGMSKLMGETTMRIHCDTNGIPCVVLRYGSLYGSEDDLPNALVTFLDKALADETIELQGDGSGTRSYIHIDDAARMIIAALQYPGSGVFNAAHPDPISMRQLAETAIGVAGKGSIKWVQPSVAPVHRALDASRLNLLPFAPTIDLAEGMRLRIKEIDSKK